MKQPGEMAGLEWGRKEQLWDHRVPRFPSGTCEPPINLLANFKSPPQLALIVSIAGSLLTETKE